jgi:O-antigen/teichoic acid export membrane protein
LTERPHDVRRLPAVKNLTEKIIRGGAARMLAQAANFVVRAGSLMVLARLLDPKDFGLVGMVTAFTGILSLFRDFGLSTASVQRAEVSDEQMSTLFWINVAVGVALTMIALAAAPAIARFYGEPRLFALTALLAVGFLFNAVGVQHSALLQRQMRFTTLAVVNVAGLIVSAGAAIVMARVGYGYWALVIMTIVQPLVSTIGMWLAVAWVPGRPRRRAGLRSMMKFGGTVTLNGLIVYVAYNLEKVLLGRFWGVDAIGMYGRAYQLVGIPTENLNTAVGEVAFSALSRVQNDRERIRSYFLKGYSLVVAMTIPITILSAVFAKEAILVFLGPKWSAVTPIFRLLTPTIIIFAMINPFAWLLFAIGDVGRSLKIALVIAPLVIVGYLIGLPFGPTGVALGYSMAMTLWVVPHILWCVHGTPVSFTDVVGAVGRPLLSGAVAAVPALMYQLADVQSHSPLVKLVAGASLFLAAYAGMLLYVMGQKGFYLNLVRGIKGSTGAATDDLAVTT